MNRLFKLWVSLGLLTLVPACAHKPKVVSGPPVIAKVAVPVACVPVKVEPKQLPQAQKGMGIYDLAKVAAARIEVLLGDQARLQAANANPCPDTKETK